MVLHGSLQLHNSQCERVCGRRSGLLDRRPGAINLPAPWSYAGPTPAALPTFNYSYAGFSGMTDIEQVAFIYWAQGTTSAEQIQVTATANYQNGAMLITIPDLSGLTGFIAPAPSSTGVGWIASVNQASLCSRFPPTEPCLPWRTPGTTPSRRSRSEADL